MKSKHSEPVKCIYFQAVTIVCLHLTSDGPHI